MNEDFLIKLVNSEIAGKNNAIHAYDKMIWTVRTGFLTLVFVAWSFVIKAAAVATMIESGLFQREAVGPRVVAAGPLRQARADASCPVAGFSGDAGGNDRVS